MLRLDCLRSIYSELENCLVVTIMGAVAAELQSLGHRPNFFYLQHAMGLASSTGLGLGFVLAGTNRDCHRRRRFAFDESWQSQHDGALPSQEAGTRSFRQRKPALGRRLPDGDEHRHGSRRDCARFRNSTSRNCAQC